jgi:hypothetical protein
MCAKVGKKPHPNPSPKERGFKNMKQKNLLFWWRFRRELPGQTVRLCTTTVRYRTVLRGLKIANI